MPHNQGAAVILVGAIWCAEHKALTMGEQCGMCQNEGVKVG